MVFVVGMREVSILSTYIVMCLPTPKKSSQLLKRLIVQNYTFDGFLIALFIIGVFFILLFLCKTKQNKTKKAENSV